MTMRSLEQLTEDLAKHVEACEKGKDNRTRNRAALLIRSANAKIDMILKRTSPHMPEEVSGFSYEGGPEESYEDDLEQDPMFSDPETWGFYEREDVPYYIAQELEGGSQQQYEKYLDTKKGRILLGDVETDIVPSDEGECYVQFTTRVGTVFGAGDNWEIAMARALAAYKEILRRVKIKVREIPQKVAFEFIAAVHRHHDPPQGDKFRLGAFADVNGVETLIGVVIVGRPPSRMLEKKEPKTLEVTRMATLAGASGLNSQLYSAAWREAQKRGYDKLITYVLESEPGTSLKASNWWIEQQDVGGGKWDRPARRRADHHPTEKKVRWAISKKGRPQPAAKEKP